MGVSSVLYGRIVSINVNLPNVFQCKQGGKTPAVNQPPRLPLILDIADFTGQLGSNSERVYRQDAEVFAPWIQDQGLMLSTLHLPTHSHRLPQIYIGNLKMEQEYTIAVFVTLTSEGEI